MSSARFYRNTVHVTMKHGDWVAFKNIDNKGLCSRPQEYVSQTEFTVKVRHPRTKATCIKDKTSIRMVCDSRQEADDVYREGRTLLAQHDDELHRLRMRQIADVVNLEWKHSTPGAKPLRNGIGQFMETA